MASIDFDTSITISNTATTTHDTKVVVGAPGSVSHDTSTVVNPRLSFIAGGEMLTFGRGPRRPARSLSLLQAQAMSSGGVRFGFDSYAAEDVISLEFAAMSSSDYQALSSFFFDTVKGMQGSFIWADVDSVPTTVRFADPALNAEQIAGDRFNVSLVLRVVA